MRRDRMDSRWRQCTIYNLRLEIYKAIELLNGVLMKLGLYTITYLGLWYRGAALTLEQILERARSYGYAGIEIDGKRPHGNPVDLPTRRCRELRTRADDTGVAIYAVAANNDF